MGWGTHVNSWLIHVNVWQKSLQYCKVISLQLIKINGKNQIHVYICTGTPQNITAVVIANSPIFKICYNSKLCFTLYIDTIEL